MGDLINPYAGRAASSGASGCWRWRFCGWRGERIRSLCRGADGALQLGDDYPGSGFNQPAGVAVDGSGNVFVTDSGNNAVKVILAAGGYTTVNTLGSGFFTPAGVAVDGSGNVFVVIPSTMRW